MVESPPQYPINMLDQRKISLIQGILLRLVPIIQRHLLTIINQPTMLEPKLALQPRFIRHIFPERRSQGAHDVCGELDDEGHEEETFATNAAG